MLEILTGLISGTISGTGMGGGTILILILSVFMKIDQHVAQATNLIFFIPTSIAAIIASYKEKTINFKLGIQVTIVGIIGAVIGAIIATKTDVNKLKKYFGIFLIIITIHEIYSLVKMYMKKRKNT